MNTSVAMADARTEIRIGHLQHTSQALLLDPTCHLPLYSELILNVCIFHKAHKFFTLVTLVVIVTTVKTIRIVNYC
jgi:hypothetical protein